MSQCVPDEEMEEENSIVEFHSIDHSINSSNSLLLDVSKSVDYDVAELTWENGHIAMQGLGIPRLVWDKSCIDGMLESIVNQATGLFSVNSDGDITDVDWVNPVGATFPTITTDVIVPCEPSTYVEGSCSVAMGINNFNTNVRMSESAMGMNSFNTNTNLRMNESATCQGTDTLQLTLNALERELCGTSPMHSQDFNKASAHDHFISHTNAQRKTGDEEGKTKLNIGKSSASLKKSRAAAIHNQSERKRRDKINQRMKTLQKLVPNASKSIDKASMLDEVIEYLKQLQAHVHMMNMRTNMPSMMLPLAMQQPQMPMMGMGMGVMDMNAINHAAVAVVPPVIPPAAAFMPTPWNNPVGTVMPDPLAALPVGTAMPDPLAALLARQSQPMTIDAYSRLVAMYRQTMQQPPT